MATGWRANGTIRCVDQSRQEEPWRCVRKWHVSRPSMSMVMLLMRAMLRVCAMT